jgi:hypothetical protein
MYIYIYIYIYICIYVHLCTYIYIGLLLPQATTSGYTNEGIYGTRRSNLNVNRELIDIWLLKLLGGEINWTLAVNECIPDGLIEGHEGE